MSDNDLTCALCAAVFVLILAIMWSWDARAEFDPYCWEFNAKIHKICYTSGFYGVCYR